MRRPIQIKIITLGESQTGKTCLIKRYCEQRFVSKHIPTIGIDFGVKPLAVSAENKSLDTRINFFDCSGDSDYLETRNEFYSPDISGAILVFDVTDRKSYNRLHLWLKETKRYGLNLEKIPTILCANKVDKHPQREVSEKEARSFAASHGLAHFETSAQSGANVVRVFDSLFEAVVQKQL